jgi:hypothetical protein
MGAPDLLQHLRGAGFKVSAADGGGIRIAPAGALTDAHRQAIRDHRAELLALLATPTTTDPAPEFLALVAWTDADIARFTARRDRLIRWGYSTTDAEALAERLTRRDRSGDDRRLCLECSNHRPGRCANHRAARLHSPELGRDLAELLQRCPGFRP